MDLKGSRTEANLMAAFAGESMARNKYTFFASQAKKEGFEQISGIFLETAENEKEHAKLWYKLAVGIGNTAENLKTAASGEHEEWTQMYKEFEQIAREEGFESIANMFKEVGEVEEEHEKRYNKLIQNVEDGKVFKKDEPIAWRCRNCGYVHYGTEAPDVCPACAHPQAYYEVAAENF